MSARSHSVGELCPDREIADVSCGGDGVVHDRLFACIETRCSRGDAGIAERSAVLMFFASFAPPRVPILLLTQRKTGDLAAARSTDANEIGPTARRRNPRATALPRRRRPFR